MYATKTTKILVGETLHNIVILVEGKLAGAALCATHMFAKHIPNDLWIATAHHQLERSIFGTRLLGLAGKLDIAANKQENGECHEGKHGDETSKIDGQAD